MTSKQRANLRAMASNIEAIFQIGKGNISEDFLSGLNDALEKRELIKLNVLKTCEYSAKELKDILAKRLSAEAVASIGNKVILYRYSHTEGVKHIEF